MMRRGGGPRVGRSLTPDAARRLAVRRVGHPAGARHRAARGRTRHARHGPHWTAGIRDAEIRARLRAEFDRYREAFRPLAAAVLRAEPERFASVTPDGLAAVAVSFIKGCAVQSMIDPEHFDIGQYLRAAEGLMAQFGAPAGAPARA
jgi:hypothetical protein